MKLKKTILGLAVVAVAGVNAWLANDTNLYNSDLTLENVDQIAGATEIFAEYVLFREDGSIKKITYCDACGENECVIDKNGGGTVVGTGVKYHMFPVKKMYGVSEETLKDMIHHSCNN